MINGYELSRAWFNWSFENPEKIKPIHTAIYFFAMEHCNRLGGKDKFGFPSQMTMDAIGIKKYQTYGQALHELVEWGFITMIQISKNQYSANIISINATPKNGKARGKALDKALIKHRAKQGQSIGQSMDSIVKPLTNEPLTNEHTATPLELKFNEFLVFRKEIRKKVTPSQLQPLKNKLWELSGKNEDNAIQILQNSIVNGWQGIFELQKTKNNEKQNNDWAANEKRKVADKLNNYFNNQNN